MSKNPYSKSCITVNIMGSSNIVMMGLRSLKGREGQLCVCVCGCVCVCVRACVRE